MARDFRSIIAWQKADDLVYDIYKVTAEFFPEEERYSLTSQIRSATLSIPANIAEGSGRSTLKDFLRFLYISQGSLSEVEYYLHFANRLDYFDKGMYTSLEERRAEVGRVLHGFINSIKQKISSGEIT